MWKKVELTGLTPVASLEGAALDWAVAKAEGVDGYIVNESFMTRWTDDECEDGVDYHYSTDWAQGGPIIEREGINLRALSGALWEAETWSAEGGQYLLDGPTPLDSCRCVVMWQANWVMKSKCLMNFCKVERRTK
jgi:hypothetical protein